MHFKSYLFFSMAIIFSQVATAGSFSDTFQGSPKLYINLYAFAADVDGSINQGHIRYDVDQPFKETVKELDSAFMVHADISKGLWGFYTDKQTVKTSQNKHALQLPVALNTKLNQDRYGIYYQAYISSETAQNNQPRLIVEPTAGIHHTEAKATLSVLNQSVKADQSWDEFFWGTRFKYNFNSPWNLASEITFGTENTVSAHAYAGYRIPVMNRYINLRAGYRYLEQDYKSGNFHWDIIQKGPVIGINLPIF
ncbi:hypothetical protein QR674_03810 [Acinetobacter chinensis]|uniref:Transporter n=1 Tax=Acinetobacter chinensis TaxID=2004650 RepID=A0ABU3WCH3_9GAMM|nr:hypothetical protein [Acinetobacter chinensis]MDV2468104.1 hypothetical protein [Acinetobacter chinensis]